MQGSKEPPKHAIRDPLIGATVDERYLILSAIGQGATSSVYKAHDEEAGIDVALKIMHTHLAGDENLVARFRRETQAAKILTHPNIVGVHEYAVSEGGSPYLVMDFIDGISLQQLLAREQWLPLSQAVPVFAQLCAGLHAAHQKEVIHRDLKPGNIMLIEQEKGKYLVKILDFGCAQILPMIGDTVLKVTQTGEMLGSLLYMSPEQCLDQEVDQRSDCYSLGCVLYETLTGKPPLAARTAFETMNKHLTVMPDSLARTRPDLVFPKGLEKVIFKAMAKAPAKRYQNVADFMDDLLKFSGVETLQARPVRSKQTLPESQIETGPHLTIKIDEALRGVTRDRDPSAEATLLVTFVWVIAISLVSANLSFFLIATLVCALLYGLSKIDVRVRAPDLRKNDMIRRSPEPIVEPIAEHQYKHIGPVIDTASVSKNKGHNTEILIYGAEKRGDQNIVLEIGAEHDTRPEVTKSLFARLKSGETKEVLVRPVNHQSFFWATFCDKIPYGKADSQFPIGALMVRRDFSETTVIIVQSHVAVVLPNASA
jgi:eukaryotic-like serine/threonine-protein kinase